jgi:hypothetical protein
MAFLDYLTKINTTTAVTASAQVSNDSLDIYGTVDAGDGELMSNPSGPGGDVYAYFKVDVANTGNAPSGRFQVIGATNAALTTGIRVLASAESGDVDVTCIANACFVAGPLSKVVDSTTTYIGTRFIIDSGTTAAMKYHAYLACSPPDANINNPI